LTRDESTSNLNLEMDDVMSELNLKTSLLMMKLKDSRRYSNIAF